MNKLVCLVVSMLFSLSIFSQTAREIAIIPEPVSIQQLKGTFTLPSKISIYAFNPQVLKQSVEVLKQHFKKAAGQSATSVTSSALSTISLQLNSVGNNTLGKEGYQLMVTPKNITIKANEAAGVFYGVQTLLQLFPKDIEDTVRASNVQWRAPCVTITDYPRFGWRGLMFDVSRHFFTKDQVKRFIDDMVRYKFNLLHMHLTDDEGWRVEIKSLPRLTEVGAWNVKKVGYFGSFSAPTADEPRNFGGFYTQDDIRELVQYAKERFVNILPEVDVPGHSLAAVVSYPDLSCTQGADKYVYAPEKL